jgi:L-lactate dehydrogenase complex protein LldE
VTERRAQLFITCLAEQFYPSTLRNLVGLLERQGVVVEFPDEQTCCGQPFFNTGFQDEARALARRWLRTFGRSESPIVAPSGSCVDMVRHFPQLFAPGSAEAVEAAAVAARTFEISEFLVRRLGVSDVGARYPHRVAYHASCHLLRGLGLRAEAKLLLGAVRDIELVPLPEEEVCCGFGGAFSVIYPDVSRAMLDAKVRNVLASGAEVVVACDAGCLMNIAGGLRKRGSTVKALHLVDILASAGDTA